MSVQFNPSTATPGDDIEVSIRAPPGSNVLLSAVNKQAEAYQSFRNDTVSIGIIACVYVCVCGRTTWGVEGTTP